MGKIQNAKTEFNDLLGHLTGTCPRKPRLAGGVKGHNMKRNYLSGKPRPVAGELHIGAWNLFGIWDLGFSFSNGERSLFHT
jgi:hypothetical protein